MEETKVPAEQVTNPADEVKKPNNIDAIEAKNRELLAEAKKAKERANEYQKKLDAIEQEKLESQGKYSDINKALKAKLSEYEQRLNQTNSSYKNNAISNVVKRKAIELGCEYPDAVLKLVDKSDLDFVEVDENFNVNEDGASRLVESIKNNYPAMFKQKVVNTKDLTPNPSHFVEPGSEKSIKDMTNEEIEELYRKSYNK